jgi:hypothetical protein
MKTILVTLQERWAASQHKVHKSKKTYTRKEKHGKGKGGKNTSYPPSLIYSLYSL